MRGFAKFSWARVSDTQRFLSRARDRGAWSRWVCVSIDKGTLRQSFPAEGIQRCRTAIGFVSGVRTHTDTPNADQGDHSLSGERCRFPRLQADEIIAFVARKDRTLHAREIRPLQESSVRPIRPRNTRVH
jgi:hypothetical protein